MRKIVVCLLLLAPFQAAAQFGAGGSSDGAGARLEGAQPAPRAVAPPALPGLSARQAPAPIPAEPGRVLSPNEALFDAITRGDLAAARDAVARGANFEARNVLGLTPTEAAVDRGRNEILFYLLSARGGAAQPAPPPEANDTPQQRAARLRAQAAERAAAERAAVRAAAAPAPVLRQAALQGPRLFAGDGGTPRPEIGFLGFDAGRPQGGRP